MSKKIKNKITNVSRLIFLKNKCTYTIRANANIRMEVFEKIVNTDINVYISESILGGVSNTINRAS